jgi:hypothetical protein
VLTCPCGETVTGDTEEDVVAAANGHLEAKHPELAGKYDRDQILSMAQRLVRP